MSLVDQPSPSLDDRTIPDSDALYRRLPNPGPDFFHLVDAATGESRPSSGAFMPDQDGLSVYRRDVLYQHGLLAVDVAAAATNVVVSVDVGEVRSLNLGVHSDPWPADSDGHPRDVAHALVKGLYELGKSPQLRCRRALASLPSMRVVYPNT
jgi:hypothetical protein